ncbi:Glycerophosphoryl diester phosphodiesterase [Tautonia plasticadhaerens]|uniref:Glycerophosphoryl diester phosphodiesterase n=2 Tax=Tautonia plasticadhaerens TaxID=2527974 RepID=A0A518H8W7_9BACT|nr:Glycerophosphoryl diester phosphodiesterase [Tautonia plasticadhaerens]
MIGYELLFRMASFAFLGPAVTLILRALIARTGRYAVGNTELLDFILSPMGVATGAVATVLTFFLAAFQLSGVILIAEGRSRGRPRSASNAFVEVLRRSPELLRLGLILFVRFSLVLLPGLTVVWLAYWAFWSRYDLYFLTTSRPPAFWFGVAVSGIASVVVGGISVRLLLRWLVSLPVLLIERRGPQDALRVSASRTRGRPWRNVTILAAWLLGAWLLGLSATGLIRLVGEPMLARASGSLATAIPLIGTLMTVHVLLLVGVDVVVGIALALILFRIDREALEPGTADPESAGVGPTKAPASSGGLGSRRTVLAGVLAVVILSALSCLGILDTIGDPTTVTITAHRGDSSSAPENTLAAIRAAIDSGADAAEIDVQLCADGVVAVVHDEDLRRVAGDPRRIVELDFEELRRIDVGRWFGPDFLGERIPSLDEVLDEAGDRITLNIELKMPRERADPTPLVTAVLDALDRKRARGRCVVSSLSYEAVAEVRRQAPGLPIGFIIFKALGDPTRLDLDFLSVRESVATDDLIAGARRRGWPVHVWTVNDPGRLASLVDRGIADVLTSDPRTMVARRAELKGLDDIDRLLFWYRRALIERPWSPFNGAGGPRPPPVARPR